MIVVGIGGNVGGDGAILERFDAVARAFGAWGTVRASRVYRTAPIGPAQPDFLNAALAVFPDIDPSEDEVLEMDEFAVDPQRGAGVGEVRSFEEARADRRAGDALVQTRQFAPRPKSRLQKRCHADFREIVSH